MKTIYESILSSTNSGKEKIVSSLKDWVVENLNYTGGNLYKDNNVDPSVVVFLPNPQQSKKNLRIYYNKDKERWCARSL